MAGVVVWGGGESWQKEEIQSVRLYHKWRVPSTRGLLIGDSKAGGEGEKHVGG